MDQLPIRRALISVTDKSGLAEFAAFLRQGGVELVSTGGTAKLLTDSGLPVTPVSQVTGFPEMLDGRVKTLHPHIHAGVLADKDNPGHLEQLARGGVKAFDLVCVNLYDFAKAAAAGLDARGLVEQIDIGGPTLLRAAAKNFHGMLAVPDPDLYPRLRRELAENGFTVSLATRREMAAKVFALTSAYDAMIARRLGEAAL